MADLGIKIEQKVIIPTLELKKETQKDFYHEVEIIIILFIS